MIDYWLARRSFIVESIENWEKFTDSEDRWWNGARAAAEHWHDTHAELGKSMNLSMVPPGAKFTIARSLPFDAKQLRNRKRTDDTGKVQLR